jgi:competence protein ComEA
LVLRQTLWATLLVSLSTWCGALEINHATEAELDSIRGMGPSLSSKIAAARRQAPFSSWPDLMQRTSGIGSAKAQQFSEQGLTVNGQAYSK